MTHWMEGDWPEDSEDNKAIKRLLKIANIVASRASIANDDDDAIAQEFDDAIAEVEALFENDDPRSNGWVGCDGLP